MQSEKAVGLQGFRANSLIFPLTLLSLSFLLVVLLYVYPLLQGIIYSFYRASAIKIGSFCGFKNYARLFDSLDFYRSLKFSLVFTASNVSLSYLVGLALALFLNRRDIPLRNVFRALLLLPWIIPSVVAAMAWRVMITDEKGLVNLILGQVGMGPFYFLSSEWWAVVWVVIVKVWRSFPFMFLTLLAALQSVDRALYEAAWIDGASRWQTFRYITFPHLRNVSIVTWILMSAWSVNDYETPWLMLQGGPSGATENLILLAYRFAFSQNDVGLGSATAVIALCFLLFLAILLRRYQGRID